MEKIISVDPNDVLVVRNARFGLKKTRLDRLTKEVEKDGEFHTPIEIEYLPEPAEGGQIYRLVTGHYRLGAAFNLVKKGLAIDLPAIVVKFDSDLARLKRQVSENNERENLSPMDEAVIIRDMMAEGVTRNDLRELFARPGGKGKSLKNEPASNSYLNMRVSFLDFDKAIQEKIHDGRLGVKAAYELHQYDAAKRATILDKAEKDRLAVIDKEAEEEAKFLEKETKSMEAQKKAADVEVAAANVATDLESAVAARETAIANETAAFAALQKSKAKGVTPEDRKKADEHFKAAQALAKSAIKVADEKQAEADKLKKKLEESKKKADEAAAKLAAKRAVSKPAAAPASPTQGDIAKAAAAQGAKPTSGANKGALVAMNGTQVKKMITEMASAAGSYPKVQEIFKAFDSCQKSEITDKQLYTTLAKITGEFVAPGKKK